MNTARERRDPGQEPIMTMLLSVSLDTFGGSQSLRQALTVLRAGHPLVFPTDTVYGVGCDLWSEQAIVSLYEAKRRPSGLAIPVLLSSIEHVSQVARRVSPIFVALAERFWPGGLTLIVPRRSELPPALCGGRDTIAVRMPGHPIALALIERMGGALAATSANLSGRPAPVTAAQAHADLAGRVPLILDGGACPGGQASTIVDLVSDPPKLLRRGGVTIEMLQEVLPRLEV